MEKNLRLPNDKQEVLSLLYNQNFVVDIQFANVIHIALSMKRPLFLEGDTGVGKTELATALSAGLNRPFLKLQCYQGLGVNEAVYDWNHAAQMLTTRLSNFSSKHESISSKEVFAEDYLIRRPLLQSLMGVNGESPVLLIDEIDRADAAFEAILLEILADYQFTIPELGSIKAIEPPIIIITSNKTRDIHDALRRRCIYHHLEWPEVKEEKNILKAKMPDAGTQISSNIDGFVKSLELFISKNRKQPKAEIQWASNLMDLDSFELEPTRLSHAFKVYFKYRSELSKSDDPNVGEILKRAQEELEEYQI